MVGNDWCFGEEDLKIHVRDFFKELDTRNYQVSGMFPCRRNFPVILTNEISNLLALAIDEEVRKAVFSMTPLKALGMDGLQASFFQSQWEIVGPSICKFVRNSLGGVLLDLNLNNTLLLLIPNIQSLERIIQFRPISLCSVLYKILTKTIVSRLRPLMVILTSQNQFSFIPSIDIANNIIVAHSLKNFKGSTSGMILKIDLEKRYDRVRWELLRDTLLITGLLGRLIGIIMQCVSSTSFQVLWNGNTTDFFQSSQGIR